MSASAAKKTLSEMLDDAFSGPAVEIDRDDPFWRGIARICAVGPYRGLRVFDGGAAAALPAQPLPLLRPRRPLW
jgi:hypothetical protein